MMPQMSTVYSPTASVNSFETMWRKDILPPKNEMRLHLNIICNQSKRTNFEVSRALDPIQEQEIKEGQRTLTGLQIKYDVLFRIKELLVDALRHSERLSGPSLDDVQLFLDPLTLARRPGVFLLDNGNFRLLWKNNDSKEQVGLQFLGEGIVQFVMFAKRELRGAMGRIAGYDTLPEIRALILGSSSYSSLLFG
jgi:hypothetical protein